MSNIKTYTAKATWYNDSEITLQVNHDILTPELATLINDFWSENDERLRAADGDVVQAVIRLFAVCAISCLMGQGGACFGSNKLDSGMWWTQKVLDDQGEGWPDAENLGILITSCAIESVGFDDIELEAV